MEEKKAVINQNKAPIYEALQTFRQMRVVPFDVPGHKHGRGNPELTAFLGEQCVSIDVNSMKPLDNLCHPVSVILEAEKLAAEAMGRRKYDPEEFREKVTEIRVPENGRLIFVFKDGHAVEKQHGFEWPDGRRCHICQQ